MTQIENLSCLLRSVHFILFFFIFLANGISQSFPFPTENVSWTVVAIVDDPFNQQTTTTHLGINGDTIINEINYSKVYINRGDFGAINPEPKFNPATAGYFAAVREDEEQKFWVIFQDSPDHEILFYDFSLELNDSFYFDQPLAQEYISVYDITEIEINGEPRKQIDFISSGGDVSWIEGIGSTRDNLYGHWSAIANFYYELNCFTHNDIELYGPCDYETNVNETFIEIPALKLEPNPVIDILHINTSPLIHYYKEIAILSTQGQAIKSFQDVTNNRIDVSDLQTGIYVAIFINIDGTRTVKKFVKN